MPGNPERTPVSVDRARCTGCGSCVDVCPADAIVLVDGTARVDREACTGCSKCVEACPQAAIQLVIQSERMPAPQRRAPDVRRRMPLAAGAGAANRPSM